MKNLLLFVISLLLITYGCNKKNDEILKLKEKELEIRQQELELEKKKLEAQNPNNNQESNLNVLNINLNGVWNGTIKDGSYWKVEINKFDGKNFEGVNIIYWKEYPEGYRAIFTGTMDSRGEIIMYGDINIKRAGKYIGRISNNGDQMDGQWYRYSDNGSFNWSQKR